MNALWETVGTVASALFAGLSYYQANGSKRARQRADAAEERAVAAEQRAAQNLHLAQDLTASARTQAVEMRRMVEQIQGPPVSLQHVRGRLFNLRNNRLDQALKIRILNISDLVSFHVQNSSGEILTSPEGHPVQVTSIAPGDFIQMFLMGPSLQVDVDGNRMSLPINPSS